MNKIEAVIFDMDGLLFDTEKVYMETNVLVAQKLGIIEFDQAYYKTEIGLADKEVLAKYYRDFPQYSKVLIDQLYDESRALAKQVMVEEGVPLKPYVVELLEYLKQRDIPSVIASSNTLFYIDVLLEHHQIGHYFKDIISAEKVSNAKPDPEIVHYALSVLETKADQTVMLEDSLNGIRASHAAGVPVIMVPDLIAPNEEARQKSLSVMSSLKDVHHFIDQTIK